MQRSQDLSQYSHNYSLQIWSLREKEHFFVSLNELKPLLPQPLAAIVINRTLFDAKIITITAKVTLSLNIETVFSAISD